MRLVAVSIVKNEADIIEAFVRHTHAWVDHHLVFDHDSTDGTREILQALRAEGLPLELFTDDAIGKLQQYRSNHLSRLAAGNAAPTGSSRWTRTRFSPDPAGPNLKRNWAGPPPGRAAACPC